MFEVNLKGLTDLGAVLKNVPDKPERNILRAGLLAGTKVIAAEAQRIVKAEAYRSGDLHDSIRATTYGKYRRLAGLPAATVKAGGKITKQGSSAKKTIWYAHLVENGVKPHVIRARTPAGMRIGDRRVMSVNHPGFQGIRFMTRAADSRAQEAVRAFADRVRQRIAKDGLDKFEQIDPADYENEG